MSRQLEAFAIAFVAVLAVTSAEFYDTYTGNQMSPAKYEEYRRLRLIPFCGVEVKECDPSEPRRFDYSCNNFKYPPRGAQFTPYRRMLPPEFDPAYRFRPSTSGEPLPNARRVRTSIMSDGRVASDEYTHMVTNGVVYITGDITSIHDTVNYIAVTTTCCITGDTDPRCMPVMVPNDDVHLRLSNVRCLNLTRAITYQDFGCAPRTEPPARVNSAPPMLDLSQLYGTSDEGVRRGREGRGGRLRVEIVNGREWPPSGALVCYQNQFPRESRCHMTPIPATNIIVGANVFTIWMYRLHNTVARHLEALNPCWDDERIFREAREINIAYTNQIWYYELMPALMGNQFLLKNKVIFDTTGHVEDYDDTLVPQVSIEYVTMSRWFHTMQDGRLKMYNNNGTLIDELSSVELTVRTGILSNNRTIEGITQGFFRQPSAAADHLLDPDMGERVLGGLQIASDVMSSDMMKGRDAGLPPYYKYRKICGLRVPSNFDDLLHWMPEEQVDALRRLYETVEDVDLMAGILSEKPMPGAAMGPTLACVMADQLRHWRRADRFWYENSVHPGAFNKEQLLEIREVSLARLICDHGDDVDEIQPYAFLVHGPGNEIADCKKLPVPRIEPWRDDTCIMDLKLPEEESKND